MRFVQGGIFTASFKASGIVLRQFETGEGDRRLAVLLRERGKLLLHARGGARASGKFLAARPFVYAEFVIFDGGSFHSLSSASEIRAFKEIQGSYEKICLGLYMAELADKTAPPGENCDETLDLVIRGWRAAGLEKTSLRLIRAAFELKFTQIAGYEPNIGSCLSCGAERADFFGAHGLKCRSCRDEESVRLGSAARYAAAYILNSGAEKTFSFTLDEKAELELVKAAGLSVLCVGAAAKSARFL
ncbi:MAG: DNA repair protein RecO [Clostridiales bacterium]|jgi:DNA repair protein RecO (recombination protein O)|nr:DNA repair protein RecO [Clostridiales bacterium]